MATEDPEVSISSESREGLLTTRYVRDKHDIRSTWAEAQLDGSEYVGRGTDGIGALKALKLKLDIHMVAQKLFKL